VLGYALVGLVLGSLGLTAFLAELFPTRLRYSGLALTYGVASALFGGTAPVVAASLTRQSAAQSPAWYATAVAAAAVVCVLMAPETVNRPLDTDG